MPKSSSFTSPSSVTRMLAASDRGGRPAARARTPPRRTTWRNSRSRAGTSSRLARGSSRRSAALDVLERQPGRPSAVSAGVVQARDVRMLQRGEDLALARQALRRARRAATQRAAASAPPDACSAVRALGQPHGAHAAIGQLARKPARGRRQTGAGRSTSASSGPVPVWSILGIVARKPAACADAAAARRRRRRGRTPLVLRSEAIEPARPVGGGKLERLVQQATHRGE